MIRVYEGPQGSVRVRLATVDIVGPDRLNRSDISVFSIWCRNGESFDVLSRERHQVEADWEASDMQTTGTFPELTKRTPKKGKKR